MALLQLLRKAWEAAGGRGRDGHAASRGARPHGPWNERGPQLSRLDRTHVGGLTRMLSPGLMLRALWDAHLNRES